MSASPPPVRSPPDEKAFYDEMWIRYGHLAGVNPASLHRRRLIVDLAARETKPGMRILDVGCGMGELLRDLAARLPDARISGGDISDRSIAESRLRNPTFELDLLDVAGADFASAAARWLGRFDLVVCSEVLEHIPDHRRAAQNLAALLAPGGRLIVTVPGGKMSRFDKAIGHQRHYRTAELAALLADADLTVPEILAWGFPFHNLYRTTVRLASRFTIREEPANGPPRAREAGRGGVIARALSACYPTFSRPLNWLFYFNLSHGGEQLIAIARAAGTRR